MLGLLRTPWLGASAVAVLPAGGGACAIKRRETINSGNTESVDLRTRATRRAVVATQNLASSKK